MYAAFTQPVCKLYIVAYAFYRAYALKDADGDFAANLFPNPATGVTVLELSGVQGGMDVELVNLSGQTVLRRSAECNGDCRIQIELGKLPKGAYFVRLTGSRINAVKKLIVK